MLKDIYYSYKLNEKGAEDLAAGYDMKDVGKYERLIEPYELMTEADIDAIHKKYNKLGIINHSFTPFVLEEKETGAVVRRMEKD